MNPFLLGSELMLKETIFGLCIMFMVTLCNIYIFASVALAYQNRLKKSDYLGKHLEVMRYAAYTMLLIVGMFFSINLWVIALYLFKIVAHLDAALLFTVGFFTSVGNYTLNLPYGWRLIPSLIAFSGLFSFAGATAIAISMAHQLMNRLDQHKELS